MPQLPFALGRRPGRTLPPPPLPLSAIAEATPASLAAAFAGPSEEAARWLDAAARYGLVEAQLLFGQVLLDGRGRPADPVAALAWFGVAASAGSAQGMNMVGRCHEMGWGTRRDEGIAAGWYRRAAEQGLDWGQYNLANLLWRGGGLPADRAEALGWYRLAAAHGHAKALNILGRFAEEGWEMPPDPRAAAALYRQAAEGGDFRGQFNLATLLASQGETAAAAEWFRRAAATGTPGFLHSMAARLAERPEPEFQQIATAIQARLAT